MKAALSATLAFLAISTAMAQSPRYDLIVNTNDLSGSAVIPFYVKSSANLGSFNSVNQCWSALNTHIEQGGNISGGAYCRDKFGQVALSCKPQLGKLVCAGQPTDVPTIRIAMNQAVNLTGNWEISGNSTGIYFGRYVNTAAKAVAYSYYYRGADDSLCKVTAPAGTSGYNCKKLSDLQPDSEASALGQIGRKAYKLITGKPASAAELANNLKYDGQTAWAQRNYNISLE